MRKTFVLLSFLLSVCGMPAQVTVIDSAEVLIQYRSLFRETVGRDQMESDDILEIGKSASKYYSTSYKAYRAYSDSILSSATLDYEKLANQKPPMPGVSYGVYKNYPKEGLLTYRDNLLGFYFYYEEEIPAVEWEMEEGDSTIIGYTCNKAKGTWRGRTWTVWYAVDLPYSNGPWKLGGLPGLILSARDTKGDFAFECTGIKKGEGRPIECPKGKWQKCTAKQFFEYETDRWKDQSGFLGRNLGMDIPKSEGEVSFTACHMEIFE